MIIAIILNRMKAQSKQIAVGINDFLVKQGVSVLFEDDVAAELGMRSIASHDPSKIDFLISLGGDGTLLRLAHNYKDVVAPILGINLGGLGFLADIPIPDIYPSLQNLLEGQYDIHERMMLEAVAENGTSYLAVNDIVVHRAKNPCLIDLTIHVDGAYLNTFSADGVIVATPGGSTAYSLAAGGPILAPNLAALVLTPICPHTISNRPIVLLPQQEIQIQYSSEFDPVEVSYDGMTGCTLKTGEILRISRSKRHFRLVSLPRHNYFQTLRTKLNWTGKLKTS